MKRESCDPGPKVIGIRKVRSCPRSCNPGQCKLTSVFDKNVTLFLEAIEGLPSLKLRQMREGDQKLGKPEDLPIGV